MLGEYGVPSRVLPFRINTGDILLFDSSSILTYGTKIFTRSKWTHVAMVVILADVLLLLESTTENGVDLYRLDSRLEGTQQNHNEFFLFVNNTTTYLTLIILHFSLSERQQYWHSSFEKRQHGRFQSYALESLHLYSRNSGL
jgi:hypothetical protein